MEKYYDSYKILIIVTVLAGIYMPSIEKIFSGKRYTKILRVIAIVPAASLSIFLATYIKFIFFDGGQLSTKIYGFLLLVFGFSTFYTFMSFNVKKTEYESVFQLWDSLFFEELYPEDRQELIKKNRKFTIKWLLAFGGPSLMCSVVYCTVIFLNPEKKLPHPSGIPYRHASPDFELVACLDLFTTVFGYSSLIIFDSMSMAILSQEEAQFVYLKKSLSRIIDIIHVTDSGEVHLKNEQNSNFEIVHNLDCSTVKRAFERTNEKLQIWISHHKQILRFHDEVQRVFSFSFSIKYLIFTLLICFCSFLAITGVLDLKDIAMTTVFCGNLYATFYLNIRYAASTADTAASLFEDAFSKSWYLYPKNLKTVFHIVIMRCRRPVHYRVLWVYPLNPRSFLKILTTAYTFFTFLLQINRNK